jgi:dephospho-CoA kinase
MTQVELGKDCESRETRNRYGWWYLHFLDDSGMRINVVIHETDIFGLDRTPRVSLTMISEEGNPLYSSSDLDNVDFSQTRGALNVPGLLEEKGNKIGFSFSLSQDVTFQGEIERMCKPFLHNDGVVFRDADTGNSSNWEIVLPHGRFSGVFKIGETERELCGASYIDRQWGNKRIQAFISDWVWGHFAGPKGSLIFYQATTQDGGEILGLISAGNDGVVFTEGINTSHLPILSRAMSPDDFDQEVEVVFGEGAEKLVFSILPSSLMRARVGEDYNSFKATYLRWAAEALVGGRRLLGITEYMRVRRKEAEEQNPTIILLAGWSGAGKTVVADALAQRTGMIPIRVKDVYGRLARASGHERSRDWLQAVGWKVFLQESLDATLEMMQKIGSRAYILDGVSGTEMIEAIGRFFPQANLVTVHIDTDQSIRQARIASRQGLAEIEAIGERQFRDELLVEAGLRSVVEGADIMVNNEGSIEEVVEFLVAQLESRV